MTLKTKEDDPKATVTLPGTVDKIIPAIYGLKPEQAQIVVEDADDTERYGLRTRCKMCRVMPSV
jgi:hypothetical protein